MQVMRTPQGTPVQTESMANVQHAVQDILHRGDALAGDYFGLFMHFFILKYKFKCSILEHACMMSHDRQFESMVVLCIVNIFCDKAIGLMSFESGPDFVDICHMW